MVVALLQQMQKASTFAQALWTGQMVALSPWELPGFLCSPSTILAVRVVFEVQLTSNIPPILLHCLERYSHTLCILHLCIMLPGFFKTWCGGICHGYLQMCRWGAKGNEVCIFWSSQLVFYHESNWPAAKLQRQLMEIYSIFISGCFGTSRFLKVLNVLHKPTKIRGFVLFRWFCAFQASSEAWQVVWHQGDVEIIWGQNNLIRWVIFGMKYYPAIGIVRITISCYEHPYKQTRIQWNATRAFDHWCCWNWGITTAAAICGQERGKNAAVMFDCFFVIVYEAFEVIGWVIATPDR